MPAPRPYPGIIDGNPTRALFSVNRQYRYLLELIWDETLPTLMFIMAHPSTATEMRLDHTLRICRNRAKKHHQNFGGTNFGRVCVTNLFAFVQQSTEHYERVNNQTGSYNERTILDYASLPDTTTVCAWGNGSKGKVDERYLPQAMRIKNRLRQAGVTLHYFYEIGGRLPKHPIGANAGRDFSVWRD